MGDDDLVTVVEGQQTTSTESAPKDHSAKYQVSVTFLSSSTLWEKKLCPRLVVGVISCLQKW